MAIRPYLDGDGTFDPTDIQLMSMALEDVCKALNLNGNAKAKEVVAIRIIELARRGERDARPCFRRAFGLSFRPAARIRFLRSVPALALLRQVVPALRHGQQQSFVCGRELFFG